MRQNYPGNCALRSSAVHPANLKLHLDIHGLSDEPHHSFIVLGFVEGPKLPPRNWRDMRKHLSKLTKIFFHVEFRAWMKGAERLSIHIMLCPVIPALSDHGVPLPA